MGVVRQQSRALGRSRRVRLPFELYVFELSAVFERCALLEAAAMRAGEASAEPEGGELVHSAVPAGLGSTFVGLCAVSVSAFRISI
jgi:hypothetical protein